MWLCQATFSKIKKLLYCDSSHTPHGNQFKMPNLARAHLHRYRFNTGNWTYLLRLCMMTHPHRSIRGGPPKEDVGGPYHGKITKNTSYKDVGLIRQSNIACYHACAKCIFLFCIFSCKQCKVEQLSQSIDNQKHQNCDHPWDPSEWAREGRLRAQACFHIKEVTPNL